MVLGVGVSVRWGVEIILGGRNFDIVGCSGGADNTSNGDEDDGESV